MKSSRTSPADAKASSSNSNYGEARPLNLGCRIFISHSGMDKDFVRHLHDKLVNRVYRNGRLVFFDEESLPTAEPINMQNILLEARRCELGILVLTKNFFMHTPNPMLELETLTTSNVRLLPLFFGISVDEFKKMRRENEWEETWKKWLKGDEGRLGAWKHALSFVDRFSGLEKCKRGASELRYIYEIVDKVASIVCPAVPFSEKDVCGMDRLCKIVNNMYDQCALKRASDGLTQVVSTSANAVRREDSGDSLDLVGIYGFAGLGKSTLCRCLCDFYSADFHGRVFWLDLGSVPDSMHASSQAYSSNSASMWRMQYLLSKLTGHRDDGHFATFVEIRNLLRNWIRKDPIFLAIDNILPGSNSLEEAHFYLECEFAKGSKIFITSRSGKLLEQVMSEYTRFSAVIKHIPTLKLVEARDIFVHEISKLGHISNVEDEVKKCVSMCVICTTDDLGHTLGDDNKWYHPLMLKSSAASIRYDRRRNVDLKSRLREFMRSAAAIDKSDAWQAVFDMLDITYAILSEKAKKVFLDLAMFYKVVDSQSCGGSSSYTWIQSLHSHLDKTKLDKILLSLEDLSFIVMKGRHYCERIQLHDLMVDFSKYKIMQGADAAGFNPHCLLLDNGTQLTNPAFDFLLAKAATRNEWPSKSAPLKSVRTISVSRCDRRPDPGAQALEQLDLRNFEGVEVLYLVDNPGLQEVLLSCTTVAHLRSFIVRVGGYCTSLRCTIDECWPMPNQMMTGAKLVWVELDGNIILSTCRKQRSWWPESLLQLLECPRSSMAGLGILQPFLCNLQYLALRSFPAESIDMTTCTNLKRMQLSWMPSLRNIHGLETLTNLEELEIERCGAKIINVTTCTNLRKLKLREMSSLRYIHGLETLISLDKLRVNNCEELRLLSIPANRRLSAEVHRCSSLERISLPTVSHPEADPSSSLMITRCPALKNVGGLAQYTGRYWCRHVAIQDLLESVETGASKYKATITHLELGLDGVHGLAGLSRVGATDVQHVGLLISALVKAQATGLKTLTICCKEDGDCGCDKIEPHFGPELSPSWCFAYHCPQVRNIASLPLLIGNGLSCLSLRGCGNVEVWPDFATMTSLVVLDLSYTSLKEWPTGVQLLGRLEELNIQDCWQLPAEEMIKAVTCKPLGCNFACGRGSLASLLADLRSHRRDQGSVADALDSRWPELVSLFCEQWRYLRYPCPILYSSRPINEHKGSSQRGAELCYIIRLMYDLWFGVKCKAGSTCTDCYPCIDGVPAIKEKLKRLLCSEIFMSLPFYVWRIGRTRLHALDEWEGYPWPEGYEVYMAFALIGSASIGHFKASPNDDLKDRMVNFVQWLVEAQPQCAGDKDTDISNVQAHIMICEQLEKDAHERLAMRVGDAVCKIARAPSVATTLGQDFVHIAMDGLKASYEIIRISNKDVAESLIRWMQRTSNFPITYGLEGKRACVASKSGKASMHTMSLDDDLGARVLLKIMPKILPLSMVDFYGKMK